VSGVVDQQEQPRRLAYGAGTDDPLLRAQLKPDSEAMSGFGVPCRDLWA
jgi:hypothetical protein